MYIIKEEEECFSYRGPYPARQKTPEGYKWYADHQNIYYLSEGGLSSYIGNFREGGSGKHVSLEDLSEARFPSNFINSCIPGDSTSLTAKERWYTLPYVGTEVSHELICDLIFTAQKMLSEKP